MANISISRTHSLGNVQAHAAVETIAAKLSQELKATYHWEGDCLRFRCAGAEGSIALKPGQVEIVVALSWLLTPARASIERSIQSYLDETLTTGR